MLIPSIIYWIRVVCINIIEIILPKSERLIALEKKTPEEWVKISNLVEKDGVLSFLPYQDKDVRQAIWEIKYRRNKIIKIALGDVAVEHLMEEIAEKAAFENFVAPIVSGIPPSSKRMQDRGFNQSEDVGRYIALRLNLPFKMLLTKTKETVRQTTLKRSERLLNAKDSFGIISSVLKELKGKNILLFDDVATTGATLREAKKVLLKGGARKVLCFTLAH